MSMHVMRGSAGNRRLDSWKEIAVFFDRDERTVKRWEKEKGLPVHRLRQSSGARVFAFTDELTRWMNSPAYSSSPATEKAREPALANVLNALPADTSGRSAKRTIGVTTVMAVLVGLSVLLIYTQRKSHASAAGQASRTSTAALERLSPANPKATEVDAEAHDLYLKGRYHWDKRTPEDLRRAVEYFDQAIARDPNYAAAYVGLANCYSLLREFAAMPSEEAFAQAQVAARRAVELDDSSAEAHNALAFVTFYWNWNAVDAEREFRRALELDPNYVTAHHWYATFLMMLGRLPEALEQIERARQLDPASTAILADKALIQFHDGEREQAIALLKQLSASQPAFFSTHRYLSLIYMDNGDYPAYLEEDGKAAELSGDAQEMAIVQQAQEGYRSGGASGMFQNIVLAQKQYFEAEKLPAFSVATTYARMGDKKQALRYLQISFRRHEVAFLAIRVHEALVDLHSDSTFQQLVRQAGLPPLA
jgi:tetratricopeptide (TPR) repeat protein